MPVIAPRTAAEPRPVTEPSSERPSESAMLMPAPSAVASPTMSAAREPLMWAAAKIGARVYSEPSIRPTSARLYDPRAEDHHHLACGRCGRVIDVDGALDADPLLAAARAAGARPDGMQVVLTGLCPDCAE